MAIDHPAEPAPPPVTCALCQTPLKSTAGARFSKLFRVTSDCRPWPVGGDLACCSHCGLIQKPDTTSWREEAARIYANYAIYASSGGREQGQRRDNTPSGRENSDQDQDQDQNGRNRDIDESAVLTRSQHLLGHLKPIIAQFPIEEHVPALLDIGCGNGGFLRPFHLQHPHWHLTGTEWDSRHRETLRAIHPDIQLATAHPHTLGGPYDLISMIHLFEHMSEPVPFLQGLIPLLSPRGRLFIQVPDITQNPFDLCIADHALHFNQETLSNILHIAGFSVERVARNWYPKELSLLAAPRQTGGAAAPLPEAAQGHSPPRGPQGGEAGERLLADALNWLEAILDDLHGRITAHIGSKPAQERPPLALFGTAIAATWLAQSLEASGAWRVDCFVVDDPAQWGGRHMGRSIVKPDDLSPGTLLVMALPRAIAEKISQRLARDDIHTLFLPPMGET